MGKEMLYAATRPWFLAPCSLKVMTEEEEEHMINWNVSDWSMRAKHIKKNVGYALNSLTN